MEYISLNKCQTHSHICCLCCSHVPHPTKHTEIHYLTFWSPQPYIFKCSTPYGVVQTAVWVWSSTSMPAPTGFVKISPSFGIHGPPPINTSTVNHLVFPTWCSSYSWRRRKQGKCTEHVVAMKEGNVKSTACRLQGAFQSSSVWAVLTVWTYTVQTTSPRKDLE